MSRKFIVASVLLCILCTGCQNAKDEAQLICDTYNSTHSVNNSIVVDSESKDSYDTLLSETMDTVKLNVLSVSGSECTCEITYADLSSLVDRAISDNAFIQDYYRLREIQGSKKDSNDLICNYLIIAIRNAAAKKANTEITISDGEIQSDAPIVNLIKNDVDNVIKVIEDELADISTDVTQEQILEQKTYKVGDYFVISVDENEYLICFKEVCTGADAIKKIAGLSPNNQVPDYGEFTLVWYEYSVTNLGDDSIYSDVFVSANQYHVLDYEKTNLFGLKNESKVLAGQTVIINNVGLCKGNYCLIWQDFTDNILFQIE